MDSKRKVLGKDHPARQQVIDFTNLTSDDEQMPKPLLKSSAKKDLAGRTSTPARPPSKHDVTSNLTTLAKTSANAGKRISSSLHKSPHPSSSFKGTSPNVPIQIDDSEDEVRPQVKSRASDITPMVRSIASPMSTNGSSQRPVFRMPRALHLPSSDKMKGRQNKPAQSSHSLSQSSPTHPLTLQGGAVPRPTATTATIISPSSTSANSTQHFRDKATTAETTQKPSVRMKHTPASKMATKGPTAKNQSVVPDAATSQKKSQVTSAEHISNMPYRASKKVVMKKTTDRALKNIRQSTSRESTSEPTKQKHRSSDRAPPFPPKPLVSGNSSVEKPVSTTSMPPPLKPPAALPDKLPLSKALLERRPSVTIVTDWRGTPVASLGNSVTVPKFEDDSSQKHTDDTEEPLVDVMDEPHESIEIEIATVFKDQLDLYRAEHQELTKRLLSQEILRRRHHQLRTKINSTPFSFQGLKGVPIAMNKKSITGAPVRLRLEHKNSSSTSYTSKVAGLPNFMVHTPLITSYLIENVQRLNTETYVTGLDDEEKLIEELHAGYKIDDFIDRERNGIAKQRAKQMSTYLEAAFERVHFTAAKMLKYILDEKVHFNAAKMLKYLLDYQHAVEWIPKETVHYVIKEGSLRPKWAALTRTLPELSEEDIETANKICQTFYDSEHISIWYLVNHLFELASKKTQSMGHHAQLWTKYRCRICHVHHCFEHGAYLEDAHEIDLDSCISDDADDHSDGSYSDDEDMASINHTLVVRPRFTTVEANKQTLAYKWSDLPAHQSRNIMAFPGSNDTGSDATECSGACFWLKQNRLSVSIDSWTAAEAKDFKHLLVKYGTSDRGPCFISMAMRKPCIEVFVKMLRYSDTVAPSNLDEAIPPLPKRPWYFFREPAKPNHRTVFVPCNHEGECRKDNCSCFQDNVPCEKICVCSDRHCARQFQGCTCKRQGRICWQDRECWCFRFSRECDQDLCGTCGADEALDPLNRDKNIENVCANVHLQRGDYKHTMFGISEIVGFGLFMAEKAKAGDFVGEYKGQITSEEESFRRGLYYAHCAAFYEFNVNPGKVMDSTKAGNSTRFINHSQRANVINLEAKLIICKTIVRLGFCATRDISPGEELFFDYGVEEHTGQTFLEKRGNDLVPVEPRKLGKIVRTKVKKSGEDKKKDRSTGANGNASVDMLDSIVGSSPNIGAFASEPGSESDIDPMELDVPLPVEDPEDDDYVENVAINNDDAEAIASKILLRRRKDNLVTQFKASVSPAGSFNTRRSARRSISRPGSPVGSPPQGLKRKRDTRSN